MRIAAIATSVVLLATVLSAQQHVTNTSTPDFQAIRFAPSDSAKGVSLSDAEVARVITLFRAYPYGTERLHSYKAPIVTRGAQGIAVFRSASPAVVLVVVGRITNGKFSPLGHGTGAIVDPRGYVLTNWHVIADANSAIIFMKPHQGQDLDTAPAYAAGLIYSNPTADLALLSMDGAPAGLPYLQIGDISQVAVAEDIHIIGHPHDDYWSYSTGVISQIRPAYTWSYSDGSKHEAKVLQMQTAINPGNSGGPVLDDNGKVLGLVAMSEEGQNLDYAVAADVISDFLRTAVAMRRRGGEVAGPGIARTDVAIGKDTEGDVVSRTRSPQWTAYEVHKNSQRVMVAITTKDLTITGSDPDPLGGYRHWIATNETGTKMTASSRNGMPSVVVGAK